MLPITHILCPTDFSEPSYEAVSAACELAGHFRCELTVMHVVAPIPTIVSNVGPSAFNLNTYQYELENDAKKTLDSVIEKNVPKSVTAHPHIAHGNAAERILHYTKENDKIDLVVIASHGRTGWRDIMFGSVAERVVRLCSVPVLTVSGRKKD
ncbi:MAG: universal stress protein [Spirochaetes bacterium]|nr:universal stress protein [Spirochaetota bacterium]